MLINQGLIDLPTKLWITLVISSFLADKLSATLVISTVLVNK